MASLTLNIPAELVERLQQTAVELGRPVDALVTDVLVEHFLPSATKSPRSDTDGHIVLRQVRLTGWPADSTYRREEIYGDDGR